ncbi:ras-related protein Rap-1b [Mrakia frigida]|uniref:Ras family protein n=1 Tax=Mrakia frigida TaxID=29902 RepID=UPI003FCC0D25
MRVFQSVVMGSGGVGKSALTVMMVAGTVVDSYDPTIEDSYRTKPLSIDGETCLLEVLDTAGIEQFTSLTDMYIKNGEGFILVFSLTQRESLEELLALHDQIIRVKEPRTVPFVLVGNKCDLSADREIDTSEGQELADAWGCPFYETSARLNINVNIVFEDMVRQIRKHAPPERFSPPGSAGGNTRRRKTAGTRKCVIL